MSEWKEKMAMAYLAWALDWIERKRVQPNPHDDGEDSPLFDQAKQFMRDQEQNQ